METSGNKYLHKKFKKQTNCGPVYNANSEDKSSSNVAIVSTATSVSATISNGEIRKPDGVNVVQVQQKYQTPSNEKEPVHIQIVRDNKVVGSVPNYKSTNCDSNKLVDANVRLDNQSSISNVAVSVNVVKPAIGNIAVAVAKEKQVECYTTYSVSVPNCISSQITTTTSSLALANSNTRGFSFDTKVNISEPTISTPNVEKSSILDTAYSKSSLISERPNTLNSQKLDSDKGKNDDCHLTDSSNSDKKQNCTESISGGKYVCTYCNLACSKPSVLQKHIRAHTNERPYPCVSCGFSFKTRSNLYKHCRSRTHANRVMGNKHVRTGAIEPMDIDLSERSEEDIEEKITIERAQIFETNPEKIAQNFDAADQINVWEQKSKPYKPRFHTAKIFYEETKLKENDAKLDNVSSIRSAMVENLNKMDIQEPQIKTNPDLLKLRINELINKNNSIVNCDEAVVIRRRNVDNYPENVNNNEYLSPYQMHLHQNHQPEYKMAVDEPLNLTNKNRKRCMSDSDHTHKSLIKELLLKNLSADPNLQCPYCRMIFQTVTELEMHKLKYCNAKSNIRYARSSSVNVASILTQNKNAFDNIPHMQNTVFPLKSPGPCLGKTRLIENDKQNEKYRTFSFDDNVILHHSQAESPSFNKYLLHSPVGTYPLSPQIKKNPIKLFGGEVKITQTSGETRSFKIESESINKMSEEPQNFMDFSGNLSENLVIKSSLQSGGTVLQNKTNYSPKIDSLPSPNIIRVYENTDIVSPNLNLPLLNEKTRFPYDKPQGNLQNDRLLTVVTNEHIQKRDFSPRDKIETNYMDSRIRNNEIKHDNEKEKELYKSNLIDFGQKAAKLIAPNLKPPNLTIPGLPIPSVPNPSDKIYSSPIMTFAPLEINTMLQRENIDKHNLENLNFAKKQINLHQRMSEVPQPQNINMYNPMNLLVDGKVIRYVPGIPGPIADSPSEMNLNTIVSPSRLSFLKFSKEVPKSPNPKEKIEPPVNGIQLERRTPTIIVDNCQYERKTPSIIVDQQENRQNFEVKFVNSNRVLPNNERSDRITTTVSVIKPEKTLEPMNKPAETKLISITPNVIMTVASISSVSPEKITTKEERKFVRPTSLALKPNSVAFKSHHGLTPTMNNQALISPDTPRVAKKYCQQYLNGNYFSYLGLKSSTKSVYCTLNKTQPFYVKHFKKLSMYSEWRQQESKINSLSVSAYDSRQRTHRYTMAGQAKADLIVHSSYKFVATETPSSKEDSSNKNNSVLGGYESNEDYTYIRGRGRGRYVCDQCGIRCKKPSMLKKHIRTHSDDRPYTCEHCNFSFKTKGNLTKHMKSKAHTKKYAATSSTSNHTSVTSSDSDDSDAESSDESTRLQEHEAAHCLLSLAQKNNNPLLNITHDTNSTYSSSNSTVSTINLSEFPNFLKDDKFLKNPEQISQVTNTNFAKNKILDEIPVSFSASKHLTEVLEVSTSSQDTNNVSQYLGKSSTIRPLTYPYLQTQFDLESKEKVSENRAKDSEYIPKVSSKIQTPDAALPEVQTQRPIKTLENKFIKERDKEYEQKYTEMKQQKRIAEDFPSSPVILKQALVNLPRQNDVLQNVEGNLPANIVFRKRKLSTSSNVQYKLQRNDDVENKAVDLSVPVKNSPVLNLSPASINIESFNGSILPRKDENNEKDSQRMVILNHSTIILNHETPKPIEIVVTDQPEPNITYNCIQKPRHNSFSESNSSESFSQNSDTNDRLLKLAEISDSEKSNEVYKHNVHLEISHNQSKTPDFEQDQSAMETLAEIATKQVKLEKNVMAKSVASEYLKLALNCDNSSDGSLKKFGGSNKETVNELIVKPEENKNCSICSKNFSKPSQLRLHMNIHYLERPFRCESCSVSFRTKGHLQKHERSASHHNKLSSSPALSSSEPRPFKCIDCNIAFRIHGHLAKHLRSKMHIMKLECLAKIPFGLYAELERANSLLTEINTTDGDLCLESLKILARKLFSNDPNKMELVPQAESQDS